MESVPPGARMHTSWAPVPPGVNVTMPVPPASASWSGLALTQLPAGVKVTKKPVREVEAVKVMFELTPIEMDAGSIAVTTLEDVVATDVSRIAV
mmetsp:Transcript_56302/g.175031  ORF Transcript_56302/g.175031 Transcript_56302/m.175031 type:complete len:94 (+) Transcript_56302:3-284(+)